MVWDGQKGGKLFLIEKQVAEEKVSAPSRLRINETQKSIGGVFFENEVQVLDRDVSGLFHAYCQSHSPRSPFPAGEDRFLRKRGWRDGGKSIWHKGLLEFALVSTWTVVTVQVGCGRTPGGFL